MAKWAHGRYQTGDGTSWLKIKNPDGRTLDLNADEQEVLSILAELRQAGYSLRQIAAELNRQGFTTRRGTPWRHQYVAALAA